MSEMKESTTEFHLSSLQPKQDFRHSNNTSRCFSTQSSSLACSPRRKFHQSTKPELTDTVQCCSSHSPSSGTICQLHSPHWDPYSSCSYRDSHRGPHRCCAYCATNTHWNPYSHQAYWKTNFVGSSSALFVGAPDCSTFSHLLSTTNHRRSNQHPKTNDFCSSIHQPKTNSSGCYYQCQALLHSTIWDPPPNYLGISN